MSDASQIANTFYNSETAVPEFTKAQWFLLFTTQIPNHGPAHKRANHDLQTPLSYTDLFFCCYVSHVV